VGLLGAGHSYGRVSRHAVSTGTMAEGWTAQRAACGRASREGARFVPRLSFRQAEWTLRASRILRLGVLRPAARRALGESCPTVIVSVLITARCSKRVPARCVMWPPARRSFSGRLCGGGRSAWPFAGRWSSGTASQILLHRRPGASSKWMAAGTRGEGALMSGGTARSGAQGGGCCECRRSWCWRIWPVRWGGCGRRFATTRRDRRRWTKG
jgi:hypothetical protein